MPEIDKNETTKVYCCCLKRTVANKVLSYSKISYPQLQEALKVPYSGEVPKGLSEGSVICVTGNIKPKCTRFAIDLLCKKEKSTDVAFHFNPRLDRRYIVRNACLGERWGIEEAASTTKCDLTRNQKFAIIFLLTNTEFLVSVNEKHFCSFKFRISLNLITNIEVLGDVEVLDVEYKKWSCYPETGFSLPPLNIGIGLGEEQSKELLAMPCTGNFLNGFETGYQLEIYGRIKLLPHSFFINLQDSLHLWPHPAIALHINPRFKNVSGENVVVRNSWINGHWGPEEVSPGFPFSPGEPFCIVIRKASDHFSIWVDGQLNGEYKFKFASKINTLFIQGDIILKKLVLHNKFMELTKPDVDVVKL